MKRVGVVLVVLGACLPTDMPDRERPAVLTVRDLARFEIFAPDPDANESLKRYLNFDGSRSIEYEYRAPPDSSSLYLSVIIDVSRGLGDAQANVALSRKALIAAFWLEKLQIRQDSTIAYGDDSYFGVMLSDSVEVGMLAIVRRGVIVYTVSLVGYLLSADDWQSLFDAKFQHADSLFRPTSSQRP